MRFLVSPGAPSRLLLGLLIAACSSAVLAGADAGRTKARACAVCHGVLGLASAPDAPNLAGQNERYVAEQLKAYRSGKRNHAVMAVIAKPLSDEDIEDLSAWFASLVVEVKAP
jgi:cytochrome c553